MKTLVLRNKIHHTIGYIDIDASGIHVILDKHHRKIGTYFPRENRTRDRFGRTKGYGFLLPLLLGNDVLESAGDDFDIEEIEESGPSQPTTPKQRAAVHDKRNEIQRKVNTERDRSADKIAALQAKRP